MNEQNLKPFNKMTVSEQRAIQSKGGKASGEARRARKTLKEELLMLLAEGDTQKSITVALLEKAMTGDTKAFEVVRDSIGEKPVDKVMVAEVEQSVIDEVEQMVNDGQTDGG